MLSISSYAMKNFYSYILTLILGSTQILAQAQFSVNQIEVVPSDDSLYIDTRMDLRLSNAAEQALNHGVPLIIINEYRLTREGLIWDDVTEQHEDRFKLKYHALSGQYVLEGPQLEYETFQTVENALDTVGISRIKLEVPISLKNDDIKILVRSRVDIDALPGPLRTLAWFSPEWHLTSEWTSWPLDH